MSFLNQLKSQAKALQSERVSNEQGLEERTAATEQAGKLVLVTCRTWGASCR